jgi:hypothetical protein
MTTVNTKGLILGMLAIGGLFAGSSMFLTQAYAQDTLGTDGLEISNSASASNSDDDVVFQSNSANVEQKADVKCKASVDDNDVVQVGNNFNTAANACYSEQSSTIGQANINEDNDFQEAFANACQAIGFDIGANVCRGPSTE